jgi:hypothetical protein
MSKTTALAAVAAGFREFKTELMAALARPADRTQHADYADKLENKTAAQVQAQLLAEVTAHTDKKGQNIHKDVPNSLGSYNKEEFDASLDLILDADSGVPMSFYGDREFLPPNITGSFESGSNLTPWSTVAMMMEDNGTLMMLRTGTDGDSKGVYYGYIRNAQTETDLTKIIMSNTRYEPAYFPASLRAMAILHGSQDLIIGVMCNKSDGARNGYFVSLTNNTMDHTKHTGFFIPEGYLFNVVLRGYMEHTGAGPAQFGVPMGYIKGGWAYFLIDLFAENKIGYRVWRCPVANLISGTLGGFERVTGWTINRGSGGVIGSDDIQLFDSGQTPFVMTGSPAGMHSLVNASCGRQVMVREDGRVNVFQQFYQQFYAVDGATSEIGRNYVFNFLIPDNKVIDVARYYNQKAVINYNGAVFTFNDSPAAPLATSGIFLSTLGGQSAASIYTTKFNQMWTHQTSTYYTSRTLYRIDYPQNADPFTIFDARTLWGPKTLGTNLTGRYGSGLTESFAAHSNIGDYVVSCVNNARNSANQYGRWGVRSVLEGNPDYQYSSVTAAYAYRGFSPTKNRYQLNTLGIAEGNAIQLLNESGPGGFFVSQARFTSRDGPLVRAYNIDTNMNSSGTVQTSPAVMNSLKQQIINNLAARGIGLYYGPNTAENLLFELIVPQLYGGLPPFVSGLYIGSDRVTRMFLYSVDIAGSRQNVTAASLQTGTFAQVNSVYGASNSISLDYWAEAGQTVIRPTSNGYTLGLTPPVVNLVSGDREQLMILATWTGGVWSFIGDPFWNYVHVAPCGFLNFPNRGLYFTKSSEFIRGQIDCGTKMIGTLVATSAPPSQGLNQYYDAQIANINNSIVIVSQKTVSAWTVYFSDDAPAMLDGVYQSIGQTTYELTPGVDINKTYHVWIVKIAGVLSYKIVDGSTATPVAEASLYLGYFTTTNAGLNAVITAKRVAIGGMVLARASQGSGIPLTSGTPNTPGRLNWR